MAITVQPISPVAFSIFGLQIRWYALAYVAAFLIGFWLVKKLAKKNTNPDLEFIKGKKNWDDLMAAVILGVILGGRLGYVLFYNLSYFIRNPLEIFAIWNGGMSFHGGLVGVIVAVFLFAYFKKSADRWARNAFGILDMMAVVGPIGLLFGRIANFINIEVMGRPTESPIGIVFAGFPDQTPRHASPLYEAGLEGLLLFIIMICLWNTKLRNRTGALSGIFAMLYAVFRIFAEIFREPDLHIGFLTGWGLTMGQLLSVLMFIAGAIVLGQSLYRDSK